MPQGSIWRNSAGDFVATMRIGASFQRRVCAAPAVALDWLLERVPYEAIAFHP